MKAKPGDRITVSGHHVGEPERHAQILEARGADGGGPFLVRWEDGHEGLFFPGSDAAVSPAASVEEPPRDPNAAPS